MSIGEIISAAREAQGMTQSDLAGKVFVTRQAVSRWETGATTPGVDMCKLLAAALDVPVTRLLEMPPEPCCQSCGLPLDEETDYGSEADGTQSEGLLHLVLSRRLLHRRGVARRFHRTQRPIHGEGSRYLRGRGRLLPGRCPADARAVGGPGGQGASGCSITPSPVARWCRSTTPWPARPSICWSEPAVAERLSMSSNGWLAAEEPGGYGAGPFLLSRQGTVEWPCAFVRWF